MLLNSSGLPVFVNYYELLSNAQNGLKTFALIHVIQFLQFKMFILLTYIT